MEAEDRSDLERAGRPTAAGTRFRRVAILVGISGSYGRGVVRGIARYSREHANWSTFFHPILGDDPPPWLKQWRGEGILARVSTPAYAKTLTKLNVPVVNLRLPIAQLPFPYVGQNQVAIAELAAEHLLSRGMLNFGFYGSVRGVHAGLDERAKAFKAAIERANRTCELFTVGGGPGTQSWEEVQARLSAWLVSLSKPVGIMASNDERGLQVLDACRRAGLSVPDDVAVIGVDNDELLCDLAVPPLSSIDLNGERVGYEASTTLDGLMDGNNKVRDAVRIPPRAVVTRRSTDTIASEDAEVNRAISFIREHGGMPLSVVDVLAHVQLSRATLQLRMKRVLGRTIHKEIERVRLLRLKELLLSSDMTIKQITSHMGFSSVQYMTRFFREEVGQTPAQFRKQLRAGTT